jgi:hypothetical protein
MKYSVLSPQLSVKKSGFYEWISATFEIKMDPWRLLLPLRTVTEVIDWLSFITNLPMIRNMLDLETSETMELLSWLGIW